MPRPGIRVTSPTELRKGQLRDYQSLFEDQEEGPLYQFGDDILFSTWIEDFSDARGLHLDVVLRASRAAVLFAGKILCAGRRAGDRADPWQPDLCR